MNEINTKQFTNGFVSVLELDDGKLIETTSTCLPGQTEIRVTGRKDNKVDANAFSIENWKEKWTVGISTQSGCPIKCKFCAVNRLTDKQGWRNLTAAEMIEQVDYAVAKAQEINGGLNPNDSGIFRILFTRMGEPALNIEAVIDTIVYLRSSHKYPNAKIQISTIGIKKSRQLVLALMGLEQAYGTDWLELQFSIHSTDNTFRKWLQNETVMSNEEIGTLAKMWYDSAPNRPWKATLNFALAADTPFVPADLKTQFDPKTVFMKISPINENPVSDENSLKTLFSYENTI
jgi:23S rRNA (adenine2503-C2)-methyltransferase